MASADATSPRSWKGEITEANADGEEIIEVPQATLPVRPGHLWCEADSELVDDDTGRGAICDLMLKLHADLVRRFEKQEESIGRMQRMSHVSRRPVPMAPPSSARPSEANTSRHSTSEPGEEEDECDAPIGSPQYRRHSLNIAPRLFSTFQDYDHALYDIATNADARISRARFAAKNSSATQGDDTYSCCSGISRRVARCVKRPCFDMLCAVAVITNSVFLGIEVEVNRDNPDGISAPMIVVQYMYAGWFLTELLLRITADGCRHFFCADDWAWSMLDLFVVLSSVWEVATDIVLAVQQDDMGDVNSMTGLRAFRIVRITRIVKVVRLMRVFRFVSAFRTLIASIADTLKSLFWALMLLVVIVYVFAVLFTQAVNDYVMDETNPLLPDEELEAAQKYYGTLLDTMLFLFMTISDGISWHQMLAPLRYISAAWVLVFLFYIFFTYFAVLNVVTAVFCQSAMESAQNDHAAMVHSVLKNKQAHITKIRQLFSKIGDEQTGSITFARFEDKITSPAVRAYFEVLGLDVWDAWSFFKLLDLEAGGDVKIEEFLMGCLRLRGSARAIDVCKMIHDQTWLIRAQGKFQTFVEVELRKLQEQMAWLTGIYFQQPPKRDSVRETADHDKTEAELRDIMTESDSWILHDIHS